MNSFNEEIVQFPAIMDYCIAKRHKNQNYHGHYFSKNKVFVNNGDQFNSKYIIEVFKKIKTIDNYNLNNILNTKFLEKIKSIFDTFELNQVLDDTQEGTTLIECINIISSIGHLPKKEYETFLDQSFKTNKLSSIKDKCSQFATFKSHLVPLQQPIEFGKINKNDLTTFKIITTLFNEKLEENHHLINCDIISNNDISFKLMQNSITIFDITNDSESELQKAKMSFSFIYNELIKYDDKEIQRCKEIGIIRKFILISTVMTWAKETRSYPTPNNEGEKVHIGITHESIMDRLPITKYQTIFEFEKLVLKSNLSKIKDIFKTYVIGTGVIYGYEENAFNQVFTNALNNPKEMYSLMLNQMTPVFHIDELAKLVSIVALYDSRIKDNYIFAVEQESYSFNNILKSLCVELCSLCLVSKEDHIVLNHYKFNSFTWDLICSNLIIDPMLDIVVPDYQTQRPLIISNMKEVTREFIEADNLYFLKFKNFERMINVLHTNQINKTIRNEKLKSSNKLCIMKEQWKIDILKAQEREKNQEYRKSNKRNNFLRNILPKLLMEISPIVNGDDPVKQFPVKTLNKTKLCTTKINEI